MSEATPEQAAGQTAEQAPENDASNAEAPGDASGANGDSTEHGVPTVEELTDVLRQVEDPELRMSILELGLIYEVDVTKDGLVTVDHTLTSPGCPVGPMIQGHIYHVLTQTPGVVDVEVNLVWDPPWDPRTMASEEVRMQLGIW